MAINTTSLEASCWLLLAVKALSLSVCLLAGWRFGTASAVWYAPLQKGPEHFRLNQAGGHSPRQAPRGWDDHHSTGSLWNAAFVLDPAGNPIDRQRGYLSYRALLGLSQRSLLKLAESFPQHLGLHDAMLSRQNEVAVTMADEYGRLLRVVQRYADPRPRRAVSPPRQAAAAAAAGGRSPARPRGSGFGEGWGVNDSPRSVGSGGKRRAVEQPIEALQAPPPRVQLPPAPVARVRRVF